MSTRSARPGCVEEATRASVSAGFMSREMLQAIEINSLSLGLRATSNITERMSIH
jgi:hypothetical protein